MCYRSPRRTRIAPHDYHGRAFGEEKRPPKRLFTPEIKKFLKDWLIRRRDNPYPNRDEKKTLAVQTGLTYIQVCNWFANWRRKLKNAGKEPQRKTWGHLIKTYNSQVQGNVEHFSICSDDSIWHEMELHSDYEHDEPKNLNNNNTTTIQPQCFYISSTTETEAEENPFSQHKYKNHIMEKYLRDCQNPENSYEIGKPSMISKWLESAAKFKPSEENYLNWTYEMNEKKYRKSLVNLQQHGLLTAVNCLSVRWAMRIQSVFTMAKLAALAIIITVGLYYLIIGKTENFENAFDAEYTPVNIAFAFYSGLFAFGGWNFLNFVTEELQDPYKNLPRAIWIALPLVTAVYVLANLAYFVVLSKMEILNSPAVAVTFGNKTFGMFAFVVPIFVALSTFGGVNGILFTSSRLFFIGSQEGHLPVLFSFVNVKRMTPIPSLLFTCATSLAMLLVSDVFTLINYFSQILWFSVAACIAGLLWLRYKEPDLPRPIKVNLIIPIVFIGCCMFLVLFPIGFQPWNFVIGLIITLSGIPIYYLCVQWKNKPEKFSNFTKRLTIFLQQAMELTCIEPDQKLSN